MKKKIPAIHLPLSAAGVRAPCYVTKDYVTNGHYMVRKDLLCKAHRERYAKPGCYGDAPRSAPPEQSSLIACFPRGAPEDFTEFRPTSIGTVDPDGRTAVLYVSAPKGVGEGTVHGLMMNRAYVEAFPGFCDRFYSKLNRGGDSTWGWGPCVPSPETVAEPLPPYCVMPIVTAVPDMEAVDFARLAKNAWGRAR